MLANAEVIVFLAATDRGSIRNFYEGILGLAVLADEPQALVMDAGGRMLRVTFQAEHTPPPYTALGWQVINLEAAVDALTANSVHFERFEGFSQDDRGIFTFPGGDRVAWFRDPAGNMLSLTEFGSGSPAASNSGPEHSNG